MGKIATCAVATLVVHDLAASLRYYADVLAGVVLDGAGLPPGTGRVRLAGCELLLVESDRGATRTSRRALRAGAWDVVLFVDDASGALARITSAGAHVMVGPARGPLSYVMFEVRDPDGNVLCFADAAERADSDADSGSDTAARDTDARRARSLDEVTPELEAFGEFYRAQVRHLDRPMHLFFTSGLLHWVDAALRRVPDHVPAVLIGSALTDAELDWLRDTGRPWHHIRVPVDDATVWDFLLQTCDRDFGWVDVDCLVLDPAVLEDVRTLEDGVAMNCTWAWDSGHGFDIAATHLLFVSAAAVRSVRELGGTVTANQFDYHGSPRRFTQRRCYMAVPTPRDLELMAASLPVDAAGRVAFPADYEYFDTLVVFQLFARYAGLGIRAVRPLRRRMVVPQSLVEDRPEAWPEDVDNELFHVFGVSYFDRYFHRPPIRLLYLALETVAFAGMQRRLPDYERRRQQVLSELGDDNVTEQSAKMIVLAHLTRSRGLSTEAARRVVLS